MSQPQGSQEATRYAKKDRLAVFFIKLFSKIPLPVSYAMGRMIGVLAWYVPSRTRQTTIINIDMCFADKSAAWRKQLAKKSLIETGKVLAEMGYVWLKPAKVTQELITQVHGEEYLTKAAEDPQGLIVLTPHFGNWELCHQFVTARYPTSGIHQEVKLKALGELIRESRSHDNSLPLHADSRGIRVLLKELKGGGMTFLAPDQEPQPGSGEFSTLFGQKAYTATLTGKLLKKTNSQAVMMYALRLPGNEGFAIHFLPPLAIDSSTEQAQSLLTLNQSIEQVILACPEQYQWSYKRFKQRPEGATKVYD